MYSVAKRNPPELRIREPRSVAAEIVLGSDPAPLVDIFYGEDRASVVPTADIGIRESLQRGSVDLAAARTGGDEI